MTILTPVFWGFLLTLLFVYYNVPKQYGWVSLLAASMVFYCWNGNYKALFYLLATASTTWLAALLIDRISQWTREYLRLNTELDAAEKKAFRERSRRSKKTVFLLTLCANLSVLCVVKYSAFAAENLVKVWNSLNRAEISSPEWNFLVPLGISFYTFQSLGYLIDVYQGKYRAEPNFAKHLLFVSWFPQIIQGPIGRCDQLASQLTEARSFDYGNLKRGAVRMLWGYMKKLVIADRLAPLVAAVCKEPDAYDGGMVALAVLLYTIQLYADFSGGIDIVGGASELFGVRLTPNFQRPYFASSLGDFWRRWHISLGAWMRDYVFYPLAMSKKMLWVSQRLKKYSRTAARAFPAAVGNVVIFLLVGLWHGAQWRYIFWGLYNGVILACAAFLEPAFRRFHEKRPALKTNPAWRGFCILRTFAIVYVGNYFDCFAQIADVFRMLKRSLLDVHPSAVTLEALSELGLGQRELVILAAAVLLLTLVSCAQERGVQVRQWLDRRPAAVRWLLLYALIFFVIAFAAMGTSATEGFLYEIF